MAEFIEGFEFLADLEKEVTFFGSARVKTTDTYYKEARKLGKKLGHAGFSIITGGGPGIMEAGNRGAYEAGAPSIGLNIELPKEQRINRYVKKGKGFHYFFTRKVMLSASAQAYVYFPGGFGTLDEFFEIITLVQTKKMCSIPIILVGKEYWGSLFSWIKHNLLIKNTFIQEDDLDLISIVDSADEAYDIIIQSKERIEF